MSPSENSLNIHWLDPNASKPVFGWGSAPDPAEGACDDPSTPLLADGVPPSPYPSSLEPFGVSISSLHQWRLGSWAATITSSGYAYVVRLREEGGQMIFLQGARNLKLRH